MVALCLVKIDRIICSIKLKLTAMKTVNKLVLGLQRTLTFVENTLIHFIAESYMRRLIPPCFSVNYEDTAGSQLA